MKHDPKGIGIHIATYKYSKAKYSLEFALKISSPHSPLSDGLGCLLAIDSQVYKTYMVNPQPTVIAHAHTDCNNVMRVRCHCGI